MTKFIVGKAHLKPADAGDVELQRFAVPRNKNTSRYAKLYAAEGLMQEQHYRGGVFPRAIQLHEHPLLPRVTFPKTTFSPFYLG